MYANEDPYGDEIDGDEDRNDGLNALVSYRFHKLSRICNGLSDLTRILIKVCIILLLIKDMYQYLSFILSGNILLSCSYWSDI